MVVVGGGGGVVCVHIPLVGGVWSRLYVLLKNGFLMFSFVALFREYVYMCVWIVCVCVCMRGWCAVLMDVYIFCAHTESHTACMHIK